MFVALTSVAGGAVCLRRRGADRRDDATEEKGEEHNQSDCHGTTKYRPKSIREQTKISSGASSPSPNKYER